ncbi:MAG: multicopper oxidase family protein, partial [Nocardioidaceae bacterium]
MTRLTLKRVATSLLTGGMLAALAVVATPAGPASAATVSIDLYAVTGTTVLPVLSGSPNVNVFGYNTTNTAVTKPGGPTLTVAQGDQVTIKLHNQLSEQSGLLINGQGMVPDLTGIPGGPTSTKDYTFTANRPGTYLYEASLLPNAQHQVAMGLYGALVVTPTAGAGQAYADASTAFDDSFVMLLSEIDPALNKLANPATFDMRKYHPRYFLINGQVYPDITPFESAGNSNVLLRYVNAGVDYHSMGVLGARQDVIALDGNPLNFSREYVAETFGPGQTADAIVKTPSSDQDAFLSLYDANLSFHNTNTLGIGGMLTALKAVADQPAAPDHFGPATRNVALAPSGTLTATIDDGANGGSSIAAAEYYVDDVSLPPTTMTGAPGSSPANVTAASVTINSGDHVVYVRGQDSAGNWGPFSSVLVSGGDAGGPTTSGVLLTPKLTNNARTTGIDVTATADDRTTGGSNIMDGEYSIGVAAAAAGTGSPMVRNLAAPVASLDATIPDTVINALPEGNNSVWVRSRDAQGNWGDAEFANLIMDKTPPTTAGVVVNPTPNNGALPVNPGWPFVRVTASVTDPLGGSVNTEIKGAEVFIDTVGADGSGIPSVALDGAFDSTSETAYADIPLSTVQQLSNGSHTMYVHAKDVAGNWGLMATGTLLIDKVAPTVSAVSASPNPTQG